MPPSCHPEDLPVLRAAVLWRLRGAVKQISTAAPQETYDVIMECLQHLDALGSGSASRAPAPGCHCNGSQPELQR